MQTLNICLVIVSLVVGCMSRDGETGRKTEGPVSNRNGEILLADLDAHLSASHCRYLQDASTTHSSKVIVAEKGPHLEPLPATLTSCSLS